MEMNLLLNIVHKAIFSLKDVMAITGRGKDYSRSLMDNIINKHQLFYNEHFKEYHSKYIKAKHLYEALGYSDDEYYNLFKIK